MSAATAASVLVIAGSDPLGYSGLQADLRHLAGVGLQAAAVPTCLTEQSPEACERIVPVPEGHVARAIELALLEQPGATKIGLVHRPEVAAAIADALRSSHAPVVLDPVFAAGGGQSLVAPGTMGEMQQSLLPLATLVTPNIPELAALSGREPAGSQSEQIDQARLIMEIGVPWVLVKGGHTQDAGERVCDLLVGSEGVITHAGRRYAGVVPRGTGCALSTLIAAGLAGGATVASAVTQARSLLDPAIRAAMERGSRRLEIRT